MKKLTEGRLFLVAFLMNLAIFSGEAVGFGFSISEMGTNLFVYYTELSNILALIASGAYCVSSVMALTRGCCMPFWVHVLRYVANAAVTLTMLVVLFVLIPTLGDPLWLLFSGSMLFHHTLCPILSVLSFLLFEKEHSRNLKMKHTLYAMIFTAVYGIVFIILNICKAFVGPYPFLHVYEQPVYMSVVWCVVIFGGAYLICFLTYLGNKKIRI